MQVSSVAKVARPVGEMIPMAKMMWPLKKTGGVAIPMASMITESEGLLGNGHKGHEHS